MVPSDWDLAPKCVCSPNLIFYLSGESPILSAARHGPYYYRNMRKEWPNTRAQTYEDTQIIQKKERRKIHKWVKGEKEKEQERGG